MVLGEGAGKFERWGVITKGSSKNGRFSPGVLGFCFAAVDGEVYRELGGGELETVTCGVNVVWGEEALRCRIADDVSSTCLGWAERGLVYFSTWIC